MMQVWCMMYVWCTSSMMWLETNFTNFRRIGNSARAPTPVYPILNCFRLRSLIVLTEWSVSLSMLLILFRVVIMLFLTFSRRLRSLIFYLTIIMSSFRRTERTFVNILKLVGTVRLHWHLTKNTVRPPMLRPDHGVYFYTMVQTGLAGSRAMLIRGPAWISRLGYRLCWTAGRWLRLKHRSLPCRSVGKQLERWF